MSEKRVVDPVTGGEKGSKPERYDLLPPAALDAVARVYGMGGQKYADRNWERGYDWGLSLAALHRHIKAFERGESFDGESGEHHLAHACFHLFALMTFEANGLGTDTRSGVCKPVCKAPHTQRPTLEPTQGCSGLHGAHGKALAKAAQFWRTADREELEREAYFRYLQQRLRAATAYRAQSVISDNPEPYGVDMLPELP